VGCWLVGFCLFDDLLVCLSVGSMFVSMLAYFSVCLLASWFDSLSFHSCLLVSLFVCLRVCMLCWFLSVLFDCLVVHSFASRSVRLSGCLCFDCLFECLFVCRAFTFLIG